MSSKQQEAIRQDLKNLASARESIVQQSTFEKLKRLDAEVAKLRELLASIERVESRAVSNAPQSPEEAGLWNEIKDLLERESQILRERFVPDKFIKPDALEHFESDLLSRLAAHRQSTSGLKDFQRMSRRQAEELNALESEERAFPVKVKPVCIAGQKLFAIREQKKEISARREKLKADREAKILASL